PRVARDAVGASAVTEPVKHWQLVGNTPVFMAGPSGTLSLLFNGIRSFTAGDLDGELLAPLAGDSSLGSPTTVGRDSSGDLAGVTLPDGTPITASDSGGALVVLRGQSAQTGLDLQKRELGGCCGYHPALGRDARGRVWLSWVSNAPDHAG